MTSPLSPVTGRPMVRGTRSLSIAYKGRERIVSMPGWYCDASDEAIHAGEDMAVSDRALAELKAEADRLMSGADIRRIRQGLKLSQKDAGTLIGGGPNAFQKYEAGDIAPSRSVVTALRLLERHPEDVELLRSLA